MSQPEGDRGYRKPLVETARRLRRDQTPAEVIIWSRLRGRRFSGYRFRRQQPILNYVADFYCAAAKLIVELDGDSHEGREVKDQERQRVLESLGFRVLRFWNFEVYEDIEMVEDNIWLACHAAEQKKANPSPDSC